MDGLLWIFLIVMACPVLSMVWAVVVWWIDRRRLERAFFLEVSRERRNPNPWRQR